MASKVGIMRPEENVESGFDDQQSYRPATDSRPRLPEPSGPSPKQPLPSSSTEGFFQIPPPVANQLKDDIALQRSLRLFLPQSIRDETYPELSAFGDKVLSKPVLDLVADAEKNLPYLKTWDSWGRRRDELITSEGWRKLSDIGIEEGMVSIGYENPFQQFSRPYQFCKYLVWTGSSAWVTCPSLMTDGVASLMRKHLSNPGLPDEQRPALQSAYDRLTSSDPQFAWTTGQWMTERQGGSDVSQTETLAHHAPDFSDEEAQCTGTDGVPLGPWHVSGFKWFSSATDSSMMVFLARTSNGISTFMAPMRRTIPPSSDPTQSPHGVETVLNGVQIQRLKNKLGTKALPTAELVLKDVRAHLIGTEGQGVKEIALVLNVARVHNAVTAIGFWGRGLSIIRAFARVRKVGLKPLIMKPAFVRTLARMHVEYKANVLLCIFVASLLGVIEQPQIAEYQATTGSSAKPPSSPKSTSAIPDPKAAEHIFRLLTPVLKGLTAKAAIAGLAECMECMGGVGYLENDDMQFNIARLYRDANVCSIWEGTTDMMAHDVLRVVFGKTSKEVMNAMDSWVNTVLASNRGLTVEADYVRTIWAEWKEDMKTKDRGELELRSRTLMEKLGDVVMGSLMILDVSSDDDEIATDALRAWLDDRRYGTVSSTKAKDWRQVVKRDKKVVFGLEDLDPVKAML